MKVMRILAYGLPLMKNMAVMRVCLEMKAEFCPLKEENLHKTVGFLLGVQGISEKPEEYDISEAESKTGEFILFAGFDSSDLDVFLDKYRKIGVESVKYKAMLTEYNALWTPAFLYKELDKEHRETGK